MKRGFFVAIAASLAAMGVSAQSREVSTTGEGEPFETRDTIYFSFPARVGQRITVGLDRLTHLPETESISGIQVLKPDGTLLTALGCRGVHEGGFKCKLVLRPIAESGRYTIRVLPPPRSSASGILMVNEDIACPLERGREVRLSIARPGQIARCTFAGIRGEKISLDLSDVERGPARLGEELWVTLMTSTNQGVTSRRILPTDSRVSLQPPALPLTGAYTVHIDANFSTLPSITLSLSRR